MLQTDDHNLQVVADNSAVTTAAGIQEIQAGNSIENESWEGVKEREGNRSGPSNKSTQCSSYRPAKLIGGSSGQ